MLILAHALETFRNVSLTKAKFEIPSANYLCSPQIASDAILKKTGAELDLILDTAMYVLIESAMRDGDGMISKRYAKPNSSALGPQYDPKLPISYILYLDADNIYRWAMSKFLRHSKLELVAEVQIEQRNWHRFGEWDRVEYIVECNLEYPFRVARTP